MTQFYPLQVQDVRRETADCVSIAFAVPPDLTEVFRFKQGQYLTLRAQLEGEEVRRSYSVCVSPRSGELRIAVKRVPDGRFSTFANDRLRVGDTLEVMPPEGRFFTEVNPDQRKHYVAFAAGSGITPVMSILSTVLATEPHSRFTLFYGNQRTDTIIFREAIEGLKNEHLQRLSVHHILSREHTGSELFSGRIDGEKCAVFFDRLLDPLDVDEYFLCGPQAMILAVRDALLERGVDRKHIHLELFGTDQAQGGPRKQHPEAVAAVIHLTLDGNTLTFPMANAEDSILDAALRQGADLPFACKGGVCCTCRARIEEGKVEMDVNYALEPEEVEAGYVLTCQSHPLTPEVRVNFDQ
ncbi:MAG: phenylacetate-CoA oxygenase/reductase subunit PaaK [Lewinella sp.]|nr:phenylacetate-CoA oxygenase/reductase subunit PaaK [Lewinella sp.]